MKRAIITIVIFMLFVLAIPLCVIVAGFALPAQYGATYYAELADMYARLRESEGKRIVVVGGSAVAFGLRGDLIESELSGYTVCPFGLYGSIGTKFMMDLSEDFLREGDIVILAPEQSAQSMSMYFGAEYVWRASEADFSILGGVAAEDAGKMAGAFAGFAADKTRYYFTDTAPQPEGVYAHSSFDENCMLIYDRPYNTMRGGTDVSSVISYSPDVMSEEFAEYVNEYTAKAKKRGATVYFASAPVNASAISSDDGENDPDAFYESLSARLDCAFLGDPKGYIFEKEWFYDSNVHCNSAGAVLYTERLVRDLKAVLGDSSPLNIEVPEKPALPDTEETHGDDSDASLFVYKTENGRATVVGMTEEGASRTSVSVPTHTADGTPVVALSVDVFAGNTNLTTVRLQKNITELADGMFAGCSSLRALYLPDDARPSDCRPGFGLFDGAPDNVTIYVPKARLSEFAVDYFWSKYAHLLEASE